MMPDHLHLLTAPLERELSRNLSEMAETLVQRSSSVARQLPMATRRIRSPASNLGIYSSEMAVHSRESRSCGVSRAFETVAISPRILRRRNVRFESGSASDTDTLQ